MKKCFVIQPFDNGKFDKRFDEIFKPAIEAAGDIKAYRVDQDETVEIIINSIEENIRESDIVFAEITTDNPNVWYELGYALALDKSVVMVSNSEERKGSFPFDVRHRKIINYKIDVPSSINELKANITNTAKAYLKKVPKTRENSDVITSGKDKIPLDEIQFACLAEIYSNVDIVDNSVSTSFLINNLKKQYKRIYILYAKDALKSQGLIELFAEVDDYSERYEAITLTEKGFSFISENMEKITSCYEKESFYTDDDTTDEIPF